MKTNDLNQITLIGRIGADVEVRVSQGGLPWAAMRVATDRRVKVNDEWTNSPDWHDIRLFGKYATQAGERGKKGVMVSVTGSLSYDLWEDEAGQRRRSARILAQEATFYDAQALVAGPRASSGAEAERLSA